MPQGSVLGPLLVFIYMNDLSSNLISNVKLFADDLSFFNVSTDKIDNDLKKISEWLYQWKMMFNPNITKQAQEAMFSRKKIKPFHPQVFFNEVPVERSVSQEHLGLQLDQKFNFNKHIKEKISKAQKGMLVIKNLIK